MADLSISVYDEITTSEIIELLMAQLSICVYDEMTTNETATASVGPVKRTLFRT